MDLDKYADKAKQRHTAHQTFLKQLKKKPPKDLDQTMLGIHEEVFSRIDCLCCANCCKTTGPLFTPKDIERLAKLFRIKPSQFITQYLRIDEEKDYILQQLPCPFLGADNYCSVYKDRPKACKEYPHTDRKKFYQINHLTLKNTLICPATYEIVEEMLKKIK